VPVFVLHKLTRFAAGFPCAVFSCSLDFPATRLYLPLSFLVQQSALLFSTSSFPLRVFHFEFSTSSFSLRVFHFESFPALESCTRTEFPVPILFCRSVVSRSPAPLVFLFRSSVGAPPEGVPTGFPNRGMVAQSVFVLSVARPPRICFAFGQVFMVDSFISNPPRLNFSPPILLLF
jgi:hypothetical protein